MNEDGTIPVAHLFSNDPCLLCERGFGHMEPAARALTAYPDGTRGWRSVCIECATAQPDVPPHLVAYLQQHWDEWQLARATGGDEGVSRWAEARLAQHQAMQAAKSGTLQ